MSNTYRIAQPSEGMRLSLPAPIIEDGMSLQGIPDALMLRASSFVKPGVERTSYLESASSFAAVGGAGSPTVNFQIPIGGGNFSCFDRLDLEVTITNITAAPLTVAPGWAMINKTSWYTSGSPLLEQYGESLLALETLVPQTLCVQEMENIGFTSTQFSQLPTITGAVGAGSFSFPTVLGTLPTNTIAPGASLTFLIPIGKDAFLTSHAYSPPHVNQAVNLQIQFNPASFWLLPGPINGIVTQLRLTQCGRIYGDILQARINEIRARKPVRIPTHLITLSTDSQPVIAGQRTFFTLQNFTGNYAGIFAFLRTRAPDVVANGITDVFWRSRPLTYNIATGVQVAASCGDNYALSGLNIYPDGTVSLYVNGQRSEQLKVLLQESADNNAYLISQIKAMNCFPFSDELYRDIVAKRNEGGAVNLVSAGKIEYTPVSTINDASLFVLGYKQITVFQNSVGQLLSVDEANNY